MIAVTGASGYIGSRLLERLAGAAVLALDIRPPRHLPEGRSSSAMMSASPWAPCFALVA
jgi:hypothetical protein